MGKRFILSQENASRPVREEELKTKGILTSLDKMPFGNDSGRLNYSYVCGSRAFLSLFNIKGNPITFIE